MSNHSPSIPLAIYVLLIVTLVASPSYAATDKLDPTKNAQPTVSTEVVLTVEGKTQEKTQLKFNLNELMQLPSNSFVVTHPTSGSKNQYTGILLSDFLNHIGISTDAQFLEIRASNNYKAAVRMSDIKKYDYLLSYKKNDTFYNLLPAEQNRGPLAIAINFDKHPGLDYDIYKHQLVWFVEKITIQ